MPVIAGVDEETKGKLILYCKNNGLTQIEWVIKHLKEDLEKEEAKRLGKEKTFSFLEKS